MPNTLKASWLNTSAQKYEFSNFLFLRQNPEEELDSFAAGESRRQL